MSGLTNQEIQVDAIAGVDQPVILAYFSRLNVGEFQAASELFAGDGALQPPFDAMIVGRDAIAAYLGREAKGFLLQPERGTVTHLDDGCTEFEVLGKVQTPWFSVNVGWTFILSISQEIFLAKVSLLASLKELLPLKDVSSKNS